jgi:hypothetical protein
MNCACIRGTGRKFDFYLELLDCDTLVFTDLSNWMEEDYYVVPEEYPMEIKFPNGTKKTVNFKPQGATVFTSESLGVPCLFDGIYCFTVESCGYTYSRNDAIVCSLECKLDTLVHQMDTSLVYGKESLSKIERITVYIDSFKSNARLGKINKATKLYKILSRELEGIDCL